MGLRASNIRMALAATVAASLVGAPAALAADPPAGTLSPNEEGQGSITWTGETEAGAATAGDGEACFGPDGKPDPGSGCDFFQLDVTVPDGFYDRFRGTVELTLTDFGFADIDLYVFERKPDGTRGRQIVLDGQLPGIEELVAISRAQGAYYVVAVPYLVPLIQSYSGRASFLVTKAEGTVAELNRLAPPGFVNHRASRDPYISHSEPVIAMDPQNHDHLIAGSKMYENLENYLFKAGAYESFDGGRTWEDQGHLPGYCQEQGQCDISDPELYRTTSDPTIAFDDERSAYYNVLDAPGGTAAFTGFNMTAHIKRPGQPWTDPITVHDNRTNPITEAALLDDKNWIAVDNETDVNGGPNEPGDGKTGTIYICWSFDASIAVPYQQIVLMKSLDGGQTWGGSSPGDNAPMHLSQKQLISGIGCHIAIGPQGEVYVTWYDNQLQALMQVKSTDRGQSFSPAAPIATISGVDDPFAGQAFRNLSIPTSGVDRDGNVYVSVSSRDAEGSVVSNAQELAKQIKRGTLTGGDLRKALRGPKHNYVRPTTLQQGEGDQPGSGADVVLFKSTTGGASYTGPVRVNQDAPTLDADQFQPWLAVTEKGQVNVMFFDRRNDPGNYFIDTYLARSNDGGQTFFDVRASERMWDPSVNPPISPSGEFIGDYQGLVADDEVAIPFWNDTQLASLPKDHPDYSPWQEVFAARVPNSPVSFVSGARGEERLLRRARRGRVFAITGTAQDLSGGELSHVEVSVRRKVGRRCSYYSVKRRAFTRGLCGRPRFARARGTSSWRLEVPARQLRRRGAYTVVARAVGTGRRVESERERGRNLTSFRRKR